MGWDGWVGRVRLTQQARSELTGSEEERLRLATIAAVPSVTILDDRGADGDAAFVDQMCPPGWSVLVWRFVVEHKAQKLIASDEFGAAHAEALAELAGVA